MGWFRGMNLHTAFDGGYLAWEGELWTQRDGFLCVLVFDTRVVLVIPTSLLREYGLSEKELYSFQDSKLCIHTLTEI